jgi:nucleoside-diphosphate-sugar epimerase
MDKAKILITGVAGFIGSHLAERLLALGYEVLGIDNFSSGFKHNINHLLSNESFTFKEGDYKNIPFATLPKLSGIFHLASGKIPREPTDDGLQTLTDTMLGLSWISSIWKSNQCRLVF